ncbi:MAG: glycerol-3-phosphate 1-O-acyltransferase PlsY [Deltaproteobacteria bacterium]
MDPLFSLPAWAAIGLGYALGSIPFGLLLTRAAGLGDVRSIGSGNIGATNVLRTGNKKLAAATLVLDALKGTAAVYLGHVFGAAHGIAILAGLLAGFGAFLGHIFPVWLGFKGGKGVATYIGVLIGTAWQAALVFCGVWLALAVVTRYSSLSALVASIVAPVYLFVTGRMPEAVLGAIMSAVLIWKHSANIKRLLAGEEPRIGAKA